MRVSRTAFGACLAAAVVGCSPSNRASVTGTVTYNGQPLKAGTVYFIYDQGGQYKSDLKSDGSYQFMDVPTGGVKVLLENEAFNPDQRPLVYSQKQKQMSQGYGKSLKEFDAAMGRGGGDKPGAAQPAGLPAQKKAELAKVYVKLAKKYASEKTTPVTYAVTPGRQVKDFNLTD
jgi:hypothetical protein